MLDPTIKFTEHSEDLVRGYLKEAERIVGSLELERRKERREIVQAMGLSQGHWYKCPNGHIYAIGDCGGAMEEARCRECKAQIGGTSHRLLASNRLASEMDGASRPAWPTALQQ